MLVHKSKPDLERLGARFVVKTLKKAQSLPSLKKKLPRLKEGLSIHFSLVTSAQMKKLNKAWRGKDYATDVLSFPAPKVFFKQGQIGELVVCFPVLKKQAREEGHTVARELEILLVHGVLHLLGFDHELGAKQAATMRKWEEALLGPSRGLISRAVKFRTKP
jgi:probable rRNA maturation factor